MTPQDLWRSQEVDAPRITADYVRLRAIGIERGLRVRNAFEYLGGVAACGLFGSSAWHAYATRPLGAAAALCFLACALYGLLLRHRHLAAQSSPTEAGVLDTLRYQRRQFERQRQWLRGSARRVLMVLLPGSALALSSAWLEQDPVPWTRMGLFAGLLCGLIAVSAWVARRRSAGLQREIEALDSLASEP
jgi:hypothetical protein